MSRPEGHFARGQYCLKSGGVFCELASKERIGMSGDVPKIGGDKRRSLMRALGSICSRNCKYFLHLVAYFCA